MNALEILYETLNCLGGKKKDNCFYFLDNQLCIKHKKSGIKYTIDSIGLLKKTNQPVVKAYRYYNKKPNKKMYIVITHKQFNKYEPV